MQVLTEKLNLQGRGKKPQIRKEDKMGTEGGGNKTLKHGSLFYDQTK